MHDKVMNWKKCRQIKREGVNRQIGQRIFRSFMAKTDVWGLEKDGHSGGGREKVVIGTSKDRGGYFGLPSNGTESLPPPLYLVIHK